MLSIVIVFLSFLSGSPAPLFAQDEVDMKTHLLITGLKEARPPRLWRGELFLSYKASRPVRKVAASFSFENYARSHYFQRNKEGVFFLLHPLPATEDEIEYRLIVDGLWQADPFNPQKRRNDAGIEFSRFVLPEAPAFQYNVSPVLHKNGRVQFIYKSQQDLRVFLAGSFNQWDPFMYKMDQIEKGVYGITLRLSPGVHHYQFIVNGNKVLDKLNFQRSYDSEGREVSSFFLPRQSPEK